MFYERKLKKNVSLFLQSQWKKKLSKIQAMHQENPQQISKTFKRRIKSEALEYKAWKTN